MREHRQRLNAVLFKTDAGNEPVREWLLSLSRPERKAIGDDVPKVQYCWPIGRPLVGTLGGGLWEVRTDLRNRIARVIFCVDDSTMILLHGFIKKSQETPRTAIDLARKRMGLLGETT